MGIRQDTFLDYDGFLDKFKPRKTTDDCYTPPQNAPPLIDGNSPRAKSRCRSSSAPQLDCAAHPPRNHKPQKGKK